MSQMTYKNLLCRPLPISGVWPKEPQSIFHAQVAQNKLSGVHHSSRMMPNLYEPLTWATPFYKKTLHENRIVQLYKLHGFDFWYSSRVFLVHYPSAVSCIEELWVRSRQGINCFKTCSSFVNVTGLAINESIPWVKHSSMLSANALAVICKTKRENQFISMWKTRLLYQASQIRQNNPCKKHIWKWFIHLGTISPK